jgi:uncharacterized LabA/DUF88 family protein
MSQTVLNEPLSGSAESSFSLLTKNAEIGERSIQQRLNRKWATLFIDGSSLYYAAQELGIEIDYSKLLYELAKNHRFLRAFFYTGVDSKNAKQQGFLLWMRRNGYRVITKELVQFENAKKANLDVEIAVDMLQLAECCDTMILVSGDGSLTYAVDRVSEQGVCVEVVSARSMISESLLNVCDLFTDLETLKPSIQK